MGHLDLLLWPMERAGYNYYNVWTLNNYNHGLSTVTCTVVVYIGTVETAWIKSQRNTDVTRGYLPLPILRS